jgi:hypothetical protein
MLLVFFVDRGSKPRQTYPPNERGPAVTAGPLNTPLIARSGFDTKRQFACGFHPERFHTAPE